VKTVDRFETPALVKARANAGGPGPILVAPYITRQTAERCKDLKLPFIDTAGNAFIETAGLLIYIVGRRHPTEIHEQRFRGLTRAGLQLTFAFLCRPDLLNTTYRRIAGAAKVALGTVGPALKDLQARHLVQEHNGVVRLADHRRLLDEWVTRYPTTLRPKLQTRRFEADPQALGRANLKPFHAFWGGEPAADRLTHMLQPTVFTIYVTVPWEPLAAAQRMRARPDGNVEMVEAFWDFTAHGVDDDIAPPLLVYADLMATRDGRNLEVADLIYERYIEPAFHETR
jgi:hypothetical protein